MTGHECESSSDDGVIAVMRTVARLMVIPVVVLLLAGLSVAVRHRVVADWSAAAAVTTLPLHELGAIRTVTTPVGLLTAGLVLLASAPTITVFVVGLAHGRGRRWREAAMAAGVLMILAMSVAFKPH